MSDAAQYPLGLRIEGGRHRRLRQRVEGGDVVVAPGAFDCLTARLVDAAGFPALYVTGAGISISGLGAPDLGVMSFGEILDRVRRIADSVAIPLLADADTGYGGPLNVIRTVREFERAGVSAIQIEDQAWPKKCGHEPGRRLAPVEEMVGRIKAAVERAALYAEAGADVLFVESPESEDELRRVASTLPKPTLANMVEGGRTPIVPTPQLAAIGFRVVIYPNALTRTFARVGRDMPASLRQEGTTSSWRDRMVTHGELWSLFDTESWTATERRFAGSL